jgi:anti-sigma factor RsiW
MNCNSFSDQILDVATGTPASGEAESHLRECAACREQLAGLRATMSAMDDWVTPEPSPFFDTRMQALLREEKERESREGIFAWLRKPVLAGVAALLVGIGISVFQFGNKRDHAVNAGSQATVTAARGTAVGDLQYLDSHADLLTDFDVLDDMDNDPQTYRQ